MEIIDKTQLPPSPKAPTFRDVQRGGIFSWTPGRFYLKVEHDQCFDLKNNIMCSKNGDYVFANQTVTIHKGKLEVY
jgi:hypothetical protein